MIDAAPPVISLSGYVALREELLDQMSVPLPTFGMGEVQEPPDSEVPRMRRHKVEEAGFNLGVAEGSKRRDLGW
jgi:hypothetical protein